MAKGDIRYRGCIIRPWTSTGYGRGRMMTTEQYYEVLSPPISFGVGRRRQRIHLGKRGTIEKAKKLIDKKYGKR